MIEPMYLILVASGFLAGWFIGRRLHELQRMKRVLRAKNPELWDLEHYVSVDEQREREERKANTTRSFRKRDQP
jgi:hypothetical protein